MDFADCRRVESRRGRNVTSKGHFLRYLQDSPAELLASKTDLPCLPVRLVIAGKGNECEEDELKVVEEDIIE